MTPLTQKIKENREKFREDIKSKIIDHVFDGSCCYNNNEGGKGHPDCRYPYNPGRENPSGKQCLKLQSEHLDIQSHIHFSTIDTLDTLEKWLENKKRDRNHENIPDYMEGRVTDYQNGFDDAIALFQDFIKQTKEEIQ